MKAGGSARKPNWAQNEKFGCMNTISISHFSFKPSLQSKYVVNVVSFNIRHLALCYLSFYVNLWSPWTLPFLLSKGHRPARFCGSVVSPLCVHQIPFALFVPLSSVHGKGSSNFRFKLIYISHKPDLCLTSLINYLHWKG